MDQYVKEFFCQSSDESPRGNFHKVFSLHERPDMSFSALTKLVPGFPKGWYELSRLSTADRVEFTKEFWFTKLPYFPCVNKGLTDFFSSVEDIAIYVVQKQIESPYEIYMAYSLKEGRGFFLGQQPASDEQLLELKKSFPMVSFPADYLAFLQIHNGFAKATDTGMIPTINMKHDYDQFQSTLGALDPVTTMKGDPVDATKLIPFYQSFGMPFYQCFWEEWYPEEEMGNVYYSGQANKISDVKGQDFSVENMAFTDFMGWLMFYLEINY